MIFSTLLIAATALFALITWRDLRLGLFLLSAALPSYLLRFEVGGIPMTLLEVLVLVFVAIGFLSLRGRWPKQSLAGLLRFARNDKFFLPIVLLLVAASVGVVVSPDRLGALGVWKAYFVEPILLFLVVSRMEKPSEPVLRGLATGGLFVAACAIIQSFTKAGIPVPWDIEGRVTSIFPYPNAVGLYLGPVIIIGVTLSLRAAGEAISRDGLLRFARKDIVWPLTTVLSFVAIILSQSEAAIVAVVTTLLLAGLATPRLRNPSGFLVALVLLVTLVSPALRTKLTFNDYSGQVRRSQWEETLVMLADRPIFGAGLNGYQTALAPYHTHTEYEIFQYPHQIILNIWTELGLLGLAAFALLIIQTSKTLHDFLPRRQASTTLRLPASPAGRYDSITPPFLALLAMTIHGLADVPYFKNDLAMMTWLLLAIVASTSYAKIHGKQV